MPIGAYKTIIFCEGKRDMIFIKEVVNCILTLNLPIKLYSKTSSLVNDIRLERQAEISLVNGKGFPGCIKVAIHFSRDLWYKEGLHNIGVIADSDKGPIYQRMVQYLIKYINTPCKSHVVHPEISKLNSRKTVNVSVGESHNILLWALEVPESLEIQMSRVLKRKYPSLRKYKTEDEILAAACDKLNITSEELVKLCVRLFENKPWFERWCNSLVKRIRINNRN